MGRIHCFFLVPTFPKHTRHSPHLSPKIFVFCRHSKAPWALGTAQLRDAINCPIAFATLKKLSDRSQPTVDHCDLSGNDEAERDCSHQGPSRHVQELKGMTPAVLVCWGRDISSVVAPSPSRWLCSPGPSTCEEGEKWLIRCLGSSW